MTARDLKDIYIKFFLDKGHNEIPNVPLIPENDASTLFISAGMHPLVPYLMGQPHPLGQRLVNVQKCIRTVDIENVGDNRHHTFFEMLGNWSLNDYFKEDSIKWSYEFLTKILKYDPQLIHVSVYRDDRESPQIWQCLGIPQKNIHPLGKEDNWWERGAVDGPCGPDTEIFIDTNPNSPEEDFDVGEKSGRYIEIWNNVFMDKYTDGKGNYKDLGRKNVDTGMGLERTLAVIQGFDDDYLTDVWKLIIDKIVFISGKPYQGNECSIRIIADHIKAAVFIIADGIEPSNKERGYVLRRLIRKAIREGRKIGIVRQFTMDVAEAVFHNQNNYAGEYPELNINKQKVLEVLEKEEKIFNLTLDRGLKEIKKYKTLTGFDAFKIYESFGFPLELIEEELKITINKDEFNQALEEHQKVSKTLKSGEFKSGLENTSEIITKYHTTTHLLHAALRQILGTHVQQAGSNITAERLRFDFTHPEKLNSDQICALETLVNEVIKSALPVTTENMKFTDAQKLGALAFFNGKYPEIVSVYTVGDFSREVCTGPHVNNTAVLGTFKITKEESAGSGKRRLYAILI